MMADNHNTMDLDIPAAIPPASIHAIPATPADTRATPPPNDDDDVNSVVVKTPGEVSRESSMMGDSEEDDDDEDDDDDEEGEDDDDEGDAKASSSSEEEDEEDDEEVDAKASSSSEEEEELEEESDDDSTAAPVTSVGGVGGLFSFPPTSPRAVAVLAAQAAAPVVMMPPPAMMSAEETKEKFIEVVEKMQGMDASIVGIKTLVDEVQKTVKGLPESMFRFLGHLKEMQRDINTLKVLAKSKARKTTLLLPAGGGDDDDDDDEEEEVSRPTKKKKIMASSSSSLLETTSEKRERMLGAGKKASKASTSAFAGGRGFSSSSSAVPPPPLHPKSKRPLGVVATTTSPRVAKKALFMPKADASGDDDDEGSVTTESVVVVPKVIKPGVDITAELAVHGIAKVLPTVNNPLKCLDMAATLAKPIAFMGFEFPTLVHAMEAHNCLEPEVLSTEGVLGQYGPGMKTLYPDKTLRAKEMQKYPPDMMGLLALEKVKLRKAGNKMAGNMSIRYKEKSDWLVDEKKAPEKVAAAKRIITKLVLKKMERNPEIKKVLMSTGNKYILVACMTACHNFQNNGSVTWMGGQIMEREPGRFELYGENAMGKILMKVRKHIRKNAAEKAAERAGRGVAAAEAGAEASGSAE